MPPVSPSHSGWKVSPAELATAPHPHFSGRLPGLRISRPPPPAASSFIYHSLTPAETWGSSHCPHKNCPSHPPLRPPLGQHLLPSPGLLRPLQAACSPPARIPQIKIPACWFPALLVLLQGPLISSWDPGPALFTGHSDPRSQRPPNLFSPDFSPKSRTHTHKGPLNISGCTQTQPGLCWNLLPPLQHCCTQSPPRTLAGKGAELTPPAPCPQPHARGQAQSCKLLCAPVSKDCPEGQGGPNCPGSGAFGVWSEALL